MGSFRYIFAIVAGILIQYITVNLVNTFGGGQAGWRMVALIYSILCFVILMIPVLSVRELLKMNLIILSKIVILMQNSVLLKR